MRTFARLVFVIAVSTLLGLSSWPAHAEESRLNLEVRSAKSSYAPGEPVTLAVTVTNRGGSPCRLATVPDAAVQLMSVRHNGTQITPSFGQGYYGDGLAGAVIRSLREVAPGGTASFPVITTNRALRTSTGSPTGDALVSWWPVDADGRYDLVMGYAVPQVVEPGLCSGMTNVATVSFTVGSPENEFPWLIVGLAIAAAAVVVVVVVLLVRSRRRSTGAAALVIMLVATSIGMVAVTGTARAAYQFETPVDLNFKTAFDGCVTLFRSNDPWGVMKTIEDPNTPMLTIGKHPAENGISQTGPAAQAPNQPARPATTVWNPKPKEAGLEYEAGNAMDNCASLYHELFHASRIISGKDAPGVCGNTGISNEEVLASFAENEYLSRKNPPHAPRKTYVTLEHGRQTLPPRGKTKKGELPKECNEKPKPEKQPKNACPAGKPSGLRMPSRELRVALDDCTQSTAQTNGDPHLTTFDQYDYDFQAVGEFVAAKSGNDFEVQTRQGPVPHLDDRTVSVNSAVAMRVGADRVGVYVEDGVLAMHVNGQAETIARGDKKLAGGGAVTRREGLLALAEDGYTITWPDGSVAELDVIGTWGIRLLLSLAQEKHKGKVTGLLGNFDGNKDNELLTRDGKSVAQPAPFEQLYRTFGDSWRITQTESLFDYKPGESTEKFTDRSFPERERTINDLTEAQRAQGRRACELAGVTSPSLLDQCILDVALTGQATFAANAGNTQAILPESDEPGPGPVDPGGTVKDGDVVKGTIDRPGERDVYQLDLGEATEFQFVEQTGDIGIEPEKPGLWKGALASDGDEIAENSPEARRFVVVKPDDATGEYSFRVVTHKQRRFDAKPGDRIDGRLDVPGRVDIYALDPGNAGTIELTDVKGCYYAVGATDDAPDSRVSAPYPVGPEVLGQQGPPCVTIPIHVEPNTRFLLAVWSSEAKPLDYGFRIEAR